MSRGDLQRATRAHLIELDELRQRRADAEAGAAARVETELGRVALFVPGGFYRAPTLFRLVMAVLLHRFSHFIKGEGWRD